MVNIKESLYPILQRLKYLPSILVFEILKTRLPLKEKKVLLLSDSRTALSGNLLFIHQALVQKKDHIVVKHLKDPNKNKFNLQRHFTLLKDIATSRYIIIDDYYPLIYALKLAKKTQLIQAWHACGAFKTMGFSRIGKPGGPPHSSLTHSNYTYTIVSSPKIRKNYAEAFNLPLESVKPLGIPRTDIFFDSKYIEKTKTDFLVKYPQLKNKKVITFAPTFRGLGPKTAYYNFKLLDWQTIYDKFKEDYIFIIKLHPFIKNLSELELPADSDDFFLNLSSEREINDILLITDILITDYSSVIFEYSLLNKPLIYFVPDLKEYITQRDFYYDFSRYVYGPIAETSEDILKMIETAEVDSKKLMKFKEDFMISCDGNSTKRFVEELILRNSSNE